MNPCVMPFVPFSRRETMLASVLTALFLLLGVVGHDPWKADEPYCVGIVLNMLHGDHWLIPHINADPFLEKPPLMFWSAAITAWLFGWALPVIDAARLAAAGWMALTVAAIAWSARSMYNRERGWLAVLLMLGAVGIGQHVHKLIPDVAQLAGATLALAAVVRFTTGIASPLRTGMLAGTGIGIAFLSKGLLIPGVYALLAVLFPLIRRDFRTRTWWAMIGWAAVGVLPWLVVWPALLYHASPTFFVNWLWDNNLDRFLGIAHHGEEHPSRTIDLISLVGLTFPCSTLAVLAVRQRMRSGRHGDSVSASIVVVIVYALILIATLETSASLREVYFLPVYPAFALLGAGFEWSPRATLWSRRAAIGLFAVFGVGLLAIWVLLLAGQGALLPAKVGEWLPLDYVLPFRTGWLFVAAIVIACWLLSVRWSDRFGAVTLWFAGATLVWGLGNSLLLPWFDIAKTYRHTFQALAGALPANAKCVTTIGFGESERAMFLYFTGRMPYERVGSAPSNCGVMVVMVVGANAEPPMIEGEWRLIWVGSRLGDRNRRFLTYTATHFAEWRLVREANGRT